MMNPSTIDLDRAVTFLFVPATRPDRISKAFSSGAEVVIVDLEDAVAIDVKDAARSNLQAWLDGPDARAITVRVNACDTLWHEADLALCQHRYVTAVMLPKAEAASHISHANNTSGKPILPIIESALGLQQIHSIACTPGCARLVFGKLDLAIDLRLEISHADEDEAAFSPYRAMLVMASRVAGLASPIEGVFTDLDDQPGLKTYTRRARRDGFGAVLLIHPKQVDTVRNALAPSVNELAWARLVLSAATASGGAATSFEGKMIDAPVIRYAERLIQKAASIEPAVSIRKN